MWQTKKGMRVFFTLPLIYLEKSRIALFMGWRDYMLLNEAALKKPNIYMLLSIQFIHKNTRFITLISLVDHFFIFRFTISCTKISQTCTIYLCTKKNLPIKHIPNYLYTRKYDIPIFLQKRSTKPTNLPVTNYGSSCTYILNFELCSSQLSYMNRPDLKY